MNRADKGIKTAHSWERVVRRGMAWGRGRVKNKSHRETPLKTRNLSGTARTSHVEKKRKKENEVFLYLSYPEG